MERKESQEKFAERMNSASKRDLHRGIRRFYDITIEMASRSHGREMRLRDYQAALAQEHLQSLNEICDKTLYRQSPLFHQYLFGISELSRIFEVLQSEEAAHSDGLSTSFADVEMVIGKCIEGCLSDCSEQTRHTSHIRSLLREVL